MAKFIELTSQYGHKELINLDSIRKVGPNDKGDKVILYGHAGMGADHYRETYEYVTHTINKITNGKI